MSATLNTDVTGRDDMAVARYLVATPAGNLLVSGWVYGVFGIHPTEAGVALVHLPDGRPVAEFGDTQQALNAMAEACRAGFGMA